jgi:hypothetical protein
MRVASTGTLRHHFAMDVTIEISYDNGASWGTYWTGSAAVCQ